MKVYVFRVKFSERAPTEYVTVVAPSRSSAEKFFFDSDFSKTYDCDIHPYDVKPLKHSWKEGTMLGDCVEA